jgi:hypothetical protein
MMDASDVMDDLDDLDVAADVVTLGRAGVRLVGISATWDADPN